MSSLNNDEEINCVVCMDTTSIITKVMLECNHEYHKKCILQWLYENATCPLCRESCDPDKIQRYSFFDYDLNEAQKSSSLQFMLNLGLIAPIYVEKDAIKRWSSRNKYANMLLNRRFKSYNGEKKDDPDYIQMYSLNMMNTELFTCDFDKISQYEQDQFEAILLDALSHETVHKLYRIELTGANIANSLLQKIIDTLIKRYESRDDTQFIGPEILNVGNNNIDDDGIMLLFEYIERNYNDLRVIKATGLFHTISYNMYKLCGEIMEYNTYLLKLGISPFDNLQTWNNKTYQMKIDKYLRRNLNAFRNFKVEKYEKKQEIKRDPVVINARYTAAEKLKEPGKLKNLSIWQSDGTQNESTSKSLHQPGKLKNISIWNESKQNDINYKCTSAVANNPGKLKNLSMWERNNDINTKQNSVKHRKSKSEMALMWEQKQNNSAEHQSISVKRNIPKKKRILFQPQNELNTNSQIKKKEIIVASKNKIDESGMYEIWSSYVEKYGKPPLSEIDLVTFTQSDDNMRSINFMEAIKIRKRYK